MIKYYKLFDLLNRRGMKKTDLPLSSKTIAKLSKGANLNTDVIDKICLHLGCQPGDIMECVEEVSYEEFLTEENYLKLYEKYEVYHDVVTLEEFKELVIQCVDKKAKGELHIDEDKLIQFMKEKI